MIWLLLAIISAVASAAQNLLHRKIMLRANPYAYAFLENLLTGIIFIPLAIMAWSIPAEPQAWLLVLISSVLWTAIAIIAMHSYKYTKVSLRAPVSETRTLWLLLLSALLLAEAITLQKVVGVLLIFGGIVYLSYKPGNAFGSLNDKGVQLTLISAILSALVAIVDKRAMLFFTPGVYGALVYLLPAIAIGAYALTCKARDVTQIVRLQGWWLLAVVTLGSIFYFFQLQALKLADVSMVYPVLRMSTLFTVLGGIIFLRERENVVRKIVATAIVIGGVILVSGYYSFF